MPPLSTANKGSARGQQTLKRPQSARARPKPEWNVRLPQRSLTLTIINRRHASSCPFTVYPGVLNIPISIP